jgi:hypothetical protein
VKMKSTGIMKNRGLQNSLVVVICLIVSTSFTGCAMRRSATFLPADQVRQIRVSRNIDGRQIGEVSVLDDPARITQVHAFLQAHQQGWEPIWHTPWAGEYSVLLETDDSWQSIFVVDDALQTNSDGAPIQRKLSPEAHQELLALLGLQPDAPSKGQGAATLASHFEGE